MMKNMLAVIMPNDKKNSLLTPFRDTLENRMRFFSDYGFIGSTEQLAKRQTVLVGTVRCFEIYYLDDEFPMDSLDTTYFSQTRGASFIEIPDELVAKVKIYQSPYLAPMWKSFSAATGFEDKGNIEHAVDAYRRYASEPLSRHIAWAVKNVKGFKEQASTKLPGFDRKVFPTGVAVGLEVPDSDYVISVVCSGGFSAYKMKD